MTDKVPMGERAAIIAAALEELLAEGEEGMEHPEGDIRSLEAKVRELVELRFSGMPNKIKRGRGWKNIAGPFEEEQRGRWVSFSFFQPEDIPQVPACYVIKIEDHIAYVGQTRNLRKRFRGHGIHRAYDPNRDHEWWVTPWGCFTEGTLSFKRRISERHGDWLMHEERLIRRLKPLWNFTPKRGR